MNMKNHYKEKFWDYDNDQLKDIIAGRFREASDDEVAAAIELLQERQHQYNQSNLSLAEIPNASMPALLEIVKNPNIWGSAAVEIAEAEILRREHQPLEEKTPDNGKKTILQIVLMVLGVIVSVLLLKLIAGIVLICFFFYCVISCLNGL
ncbi:hypothetical protein [Aureispira sp. CCB-E]|uniref:hypothetical protein n=1 Tax=Aureispira sp. CCB-E TaxID=3051121 RepID=UPI002868427C|nr:hypothetical protein [Aureispira sp. CCB-E]WMX12847.1 hypothetical protein QP953_18590 [Aureispira sp. CCB-E]